MVVYAFHFHQTKFIYPCKSFLTLVRSALAKKIAFLCSQGGHFPDFHAEILADLHPYNSKFLFEWCYMHFIFIKPNLYVHVSHFHSYKGVY